MDVNLLPTDNDYNFLPSFDNFAYDPSTFSPPVEANSLQTELLNFCREQGLEEIAKSSGLVQNGEIAELKDYCASPRAMPQTLHKRELPNKKAASPLRKRRKTSRSSSKKNKGLRHFSERVCQKVHQQKVTTYNEVADALAQELNRDAEGKPIQTDQNIRRRVYDALNVLKAMGIISKQKKEIKWIGLPPNSKQELCDLEKEKQVRVQNVSRKKERLQELMAQQQSYERLLLRNQENEKNVLDKEGLKREPKIQLPFILVNTKSTCELYVEMSPDLTQYFFNFSMPFEIHDDSEILKRAGLYSPMKNTISPIATNAQTQNFDASALVDSGAGSSFMSPLSFRSPLLHSPTITPLKCSSPSHSSPIPPFFEPSSSCFSVQSDSPLENSSPCVVTTSVGTISYDPENLPHSGSVTQQHTPVSPMSNSSCINQPNLLSNAGSPFVTRTNNELTCSPTVTVSPLPVMCGIGENGSSLSVGMERDGESERERSSDHSLLSPHHSLLLPSPTLSLPLSSPTPAPQDDSDMPHSGSVSLLRSNSAPSSLLFDSYNPSFLSFNSLPVPNSQ